MQLVEENDTNQEKNNQNNHQNVQNQEQITPFSLIEIVGSNHRYQLISLMIWCLIWFLTGCILLGTPFLIYLQPYNCESVSDKLNNQTCSEYVCSLPEQKRPLYLSDQVSSLASDLLSPNVRCENPQILDIIQSLVYIGSLLGYIAVSVLSDNVGRKKSILVSFGIATVGLIITASAINIYIAGIGLFLTGFGSDISINICFYFIAESVADKSRMKHSIIIQGFFSFGCLVNVGYYYAINNWRIIYWVFLVVPSVVAFILIVLIIQQTPYFLITRSQPEQIKRSLLKIAKINKIKYHESGLDSIINELILRLHSENQNQIELKPQQNNNEVEAIQQKAHEQSHTYSPLDLVRYPSIRFISISICVISFFIYINYYGPLLLIGKFSFTIYISGVVVSLSELLVYPLCYYLIDKCYRRKIFIILSCLSAGISSVLIVVFRMQCTDEQTTFCTFIGVLQLMLIFGFRFCVSLQFAIFLVYCTEVFPTQVRGMGIGISSAFGTVASSASPFIFGSYIHSNTATSNIMIIFLVISLISAYLFFRMPETLGMSITDEIQEIKKLGQKAQGRQKDIQSDRTQ